MLGSSFSPIMLVCIIVATTDRRNLAESAGRATNSSVLNSNTKKAASKISYHKGFMWQKILHATQWSGLIIESPNNCATPSPRLFFLEKLHFHNPPPCLWTHRPATLPPCPRRRNRTRVRPDLPRRPSSTSSGRTRTPCPCREGTQW